MAKDKKTKSGAATNPSVHATGKFAVLDYPGESQPVVVAVDTAANVASSSSSGAVAAGAQGRRAKVGSGPKISQSSGLSIGGDSFVARAPNPPWLKERVAVFDTVKNRRAVELANKTPVDITVTMPDGKVIDKNAAGEALQAWVSTPNDVAVTISQGLADSATVARVTYASLVADYSLYEDGMEGEDMLTDAMSDGGIETDAADGSAANKSILWDMMRPLVGLVAKLEFLKFDQDSAAKTVFWHSSAHMMGEALEHLYGNKLTIGPPLAGGFYYDSYMGSETLKEDDCTCDFSISY